MGRQVTEISLPYVHAFRDRHGRMRYYFRRRGHKRTPLPGLPGSKPFMDAYQAALASNAPDARTPKGGPRSLSALIQSYKASAAFKNLKGSSPKTYLHVLKHVEAKDGHRGVADMPDDKARKIIEEIGADRPALANLTTSVMRKVFAHAVKLKWRHSNPFAGIERYETGEHRSWTDAELAAFEKRWKLGTRERVAFDLLLYTAQRIGDVAKMRRADIHKGRIHVVQEKTGAQVRIPIHADLQKSLNAYGIRGLHLVGRVDGKQMGDENLSKLLTRAIAKAGLPADCVPHGLRKTALKIIAENGASAKMIAAISGHKTLKEVERYTEAASQEVLADAAMKAMKRG